MKIDKHIETICRDAGLGTMADIIGIVYDRGEVEDAAILKLEADDITRMYEDYIVSGINRIEDELMTEDDDEDDDGCPLSDPDCMGRNEDRHDECETH